MRLLPPVLPNTCEKLCILVWVCLICFKIVILLCVGCSAIMQKQCKETTVGSWIWCRKPLYLHAILVSPLFRLLFSVTFLKTFLLYVTSLIIKDQNNQCGLPLITLLWRRSYWQPVLMFSSNMSAYSGTISSLVLGYFFKKEGVSNMKL